MIYVLFNKTGIYKKNLLDSIALCCKVSIKIVVCLNNLGILK